jgi:hypothetical protein
VKHVELGPTPDQIERATLDVTARSVELATFLEGAPVDTIRIDSVIAHATMGVMYRITLCKEMESDSQKIQMILRTDNMAFERLEVGFCLMSKKKRRKHKSVLRRMKEIEDYVADATNWPAGRKPN